MWLVANIKWVILSISLALWHCPPPHSLGFRVGGLEPEARWRKEEGTVRTLIGASLPDAIFNRISVGGTAETAKAVWDSLKRTYEERTRMTTVDLVMKFRNKRCTEGT